MNDPTNSCLADVGRAGNILGSTLTAAARAVIELAATPSDPQSTGRTGGAEMQPMATAPATVTRPAPISGAREAELSRLRTEAISSYADDLRRQRRAEAGQRALDPEAIYGRRRADAAGHHEEGAIAPDTFRKASGAIDVASIFEFRKAQVGAAKVSRRSADIAPVQPSSARLDVQEVYRRRAR